MSKEEIEKLALEIYPEHKDLPENDITKYFPQYRYGFIQGYTNCYNQNTKPLIDEIAELRKTGLEAIKIAEDLSYLKKKYETRVEELQAENTKLKASKLEILNHIKSGFEVQSDYSTQCNGYKYLCREIEQLKASKSEANEAVEFLQWARNYPVHQAVTDNELYEIFKTRNNK